MKGQTQQNKPSGTIQPQCYHFGICSGCTLQNLSKVEQINYKTKKLLEILSAQYIQPELLMEPIQSSFWAYRRKARLSVKYLVKKDKVLVGFREINHRYIADIERCEILDSSVGPHIKAFSTLLHQLEIRNKIPQIEIAVGDEKAAIVIRHLSPIPTPDLEKLRNFVIKYKLMLYLQPKGLNSIYLDWPKNKNDSLFYYIKKNELAIQFLPHQFIQINAAVNQKMIKKALTLLDLNPQDQIIDLFCGVGNFSLPLAKYVQKVTGVEGDYTAVEQAKKNAKNNHILNVEFFCENLFNSSYNEEWAKRRYNKIILDPPRSGAQTLIKWIIKTNVTNIIYISCNPITLAKDAKELLEGGYVLKSISLIDMFPHTNHIEAMALFRKC